MAQPGADLPSPQAMLAAFAAVEAGVRAWEFSEAPPAAARVTCQGACVLLRLDSRVIGRGQALGSGSDVVWKAARDSWIQAKDKLGVEHDALEAENTRALAARVRVSIEVAGAMTPIVADDWGALAARFSPGVEGVAVRRGDSLAARFPGIMLLTNDLHVASIRILLEEVFDERARFMGDALEMRSPVHLREKEGVTFLKFRTVHLAQAEEGGPPSFLHRGAQVVGLSELTHAGVRQWAEMVADYLASRSGGPTGLRGTLNAASGESLSDWGEPRDQALGALALRRAAGLAFVSRSSSARWLAAADSALESLSGSEQLDVAASATVVAAMLEGRDPKDLIPAAQRPIFDRASEAVRLAWAGADKGFVTGIHDAERGMIALGLARLAGRSGRAADRQRASEAVRHVFASTPAGQLVSQMPWLGMAELELAGTGDIPSAQALRDLRDIVWRHQIRAEDVSVDDRDLAGGVVFTASLAALPSWHTARAIAFPAAMLRDGRVTPPAEKPAHLARVLASLRFLRQITCDERSAFVEAIPSVSRGGVRSAPWDQRMSIDGASLTLLCITETLKALGD